MTAVATDDRRSWAVFLSRAAAFKAAMTVALFGAFAIVTTAAGSGSFDQAELIGASRNPAAYRLFAGFDVLVWLGFGALLLGFAGLGTTIAPVRAACVAALATTMVVGMLGGYLRLTAITLLGAQYAAAGSSEQATILDSYRSLFAIIGAHFGLGDLLFGLAFLLIASITISTRTFPRGLTYLIGVLGLYSVANQMSAVLLGRFLWEPLFFVFLILTVVMDGWIAMTLWRRPALGVGAQPSPVP